VSLSIDPARPASQAFELNHDYYVDFTPLLYTGRKYIRDEAPLKDTPIELLKDGADPVPAKFVEGNFIEAVIDGQEVRENPWSSTLLVEKGYTYWRYVTSD